MELILGTAQLTRPYGIVATVRDGADDGNGPDGRRGVAGDLLRTAVDLGVMTVDTAPAYGDAESVIGSSGLPFAVQTKLAPGLAPKDSLIGSLTRLRRDRVDVLHLHDPDAVHDRALLAAATRLVGERVGTLGASVYTAAAARAAADAGLGAVQVPLNVLDRRIDDALLGDLAAAGVRVLARSALLQGLLADPARGLGRISGLDDALRSFARAATTLDRDPLELALGWVRARPAVAAVVLGAEDAGQLRRLHSAYLTPPLDPQELSVLEAVVHAAGAGTGLPVDPRDWGR